jgi:DNA repair exonuclease SbcCD ATPase subunit
MEEIKNKITQAELSPDELNAKQNLLRKTKERLDELYRKEKANIGSINLDIGTIRGQFKGLPEEIANCEKGIRERKERLEAIKKELRAVQISRELFASMSEDSTLMLERLSGEITEQFSALTAVERKVNMNSYSTNNTGVADAQGVSRTMEHLSTGTRDAFLLAARLVLARKSQNVNNSAVIVLDEPFLALDKERCQRALLLLEDFRKATLWQIVIFTKDEETEKTARQIFGGNLAVYKLSV